MTAFQICWLIAGFFLGFYSFSSVLVLAKANANFIGELVFGAIGTLITWTILFH